VTTTTAEVLVVRVGDRDDYHECSDLHELAELLQSHGIDTRLERYCENGIAADGFTGWNYISCYYGTDIETPTRELTDPELQELNRIVKNLN
jgi:hypothetical protein